MAEASGYQLGPQQRRIWSGRNGAGIPVAQLIARVDGTFDAERLATAAKEAIARHATLHARFSRVVGLRFPLQMTGAASAFAWRIETQEPVSAGAEPAAIARVAERERRSVDPDAGPVTRVLLLDGALSAPRLIVTTAAVSADAASLTRVVSEIVERYARPGSPAFGDPVSYAQYSAWRSEIAASNATAPLAPAAGAPRVALPFVNGDATGDGPEGRIPVPPDSITAADLRRIAGQDGPAVAAVFLTAWSTLLARIGDASDVSLAVWFDGRTDEELADAVGPYRQPVAVSVPVDQSLPFDRALTDIASRLNHARESQDVAPGSSIPGLQFAFRSRPATVGSDGLTLGLECVDDPSESLLIGLFVDAIGDRLAAEIRFDAAACASDDMARLARQFAALIASAVRTPAAPIRTLSALDAAEREQALAAATTPRLADTPRICVHELFEAAVRRQPGEVALITGGVETTYDALNRRANRLAHYLRAADIGTGDVVAASLERSADAVALLLGVLKAGATYLPIDAAQPAPRTLQMLSEAGAALLLTTPSNAESLASAGVRVTTIAEAAGEIDRMPDGNPEIPVAREAAAYIVFTSGSTGRPKGVAVEHRQIVSYVWAVSDRLGLPERATYCAPSTLSADLSYTMVFPALCRGGALMFLSEEESLDASVAAARGRRPDALKIAPSHLAGWLSSPAGARLLPTSHLILGGEPLTASLVQQVMRAGSGCRVFNHYGPTETTIGVLTSASTDVATDREVRLGRPLPGTAVYVLDSNGEPAPAWHLGEVFIGGDTVSRGYVRRPGATAERFLPDPFGAPGSRMYRTGDRMRRHSDGTLEWAGRVDDQIKLRGYRIEPAEIAAAASELHMVSAAAVTVRHNGAGEAEVICYAAPHRRYAATIDGHGRHLLPNGMTVVQRNKNETEYLYDEIFRNQTYFRHGIRLPDHGCVFDVGANIGMFTMFVGQHAPDVQIYSFEPIPQVAATLRRNAELYAPNARVFEHGISDRERMEVFDFFPRHTMMSGAHAYSAPAEEVEVVKAYMRNAERHGDRRMMTLLGDVDALLDGRFRTEPVACRLRALSDVIDAVGVTGIDLLKIDVQRAELDVLRGIEDRHWPLIRQIAMELHDAPGRPTEGRVGQIVAALEARGFTATPEQDELLAGTDRWSLYATRRSAAAVTGRTAPFPELSIQSPILDASTLRAHLASRLPEYMLPAACVVLDELPLRPNGKVDRDALPPPEQAGPRRDRINLDDQSLTERRVGAVWAELLKVEAVGLDESFFELGGHSLLVMLVTSRLREIFNVDLSIREFFETPTVRGLAALIDELGSSATGAFDSPIRPRAATLEQQLSAVIEPGADLHG